MAVKRTSKGAQAALQARGLWKPGQAAYEEGRIHGWHNRDQADNPHPPFSTDRSRWNEGYESGIAKRLSKGLKV